MKGIDYFGLEVTVTESDEFIDLFESMGVQEDASVPWSAFGRLMALLAMIYGRGFALEMTPARRYRVAKNLDVTAEELEDLIAAFVGAGWFDADLWRDHRVLTSKGIQKRWLNVFTGRGKRRQRISSDEARFWLLDPSLVNVDAAENGPLPAAGQIDAKSDGFGSDLGAETRGKDNKIELNKIELDKIESESHPIQSSNQIDSTSNSGEPLGCMDASEHLEDGTPSVFSDHEGQPHPTRAEAIEFAFAQATGKPIGGNDFRRYVEGIAKSCPPDCRGQPLDRARCYFAVMTALDKHNPDPRRGNNPLPLTLKILRDERGCR